MENKDDFKKKLEELAKQREEKLNELFAENVQARAKRIELQESYKKKFEQFRYKIAYPIIQESKYIFEKTGDKILVLDNERSDKLTDKMRKFFQIFYYPKGQPYNVIGQNTSSMTFELNDNNGEVKISVITKPVFTLPKVENIKVENLNNDFFQNQLLSFLQKVTSL